MATDSGDSQEELREAVARLRSHQPEADHPVPPQAPEIARFQAAMDMHELGVRLYRQRMQREHPHVGRRDIDRMVEAWLAEPSYASQLHLPSRERDRGIR
jgi:hypothetical protein